MKPVTGEAVGRELAMRDLFLWETMGSWKPNASGIMVPEAGRV